jgi:hypothetical protein
VDNLDNQAAAPAAASAGAIEENLDKTNINKDHRPVGVPYGPVDDFVDDWTKSLCKAGGRGCDYPVISL